LFQAECDEACYYAGTKETCRQRVSWIVTHWGIGFCIVRHQHDLHVAVHCKAEDFSAANLAFAGQLVTCDDICPYEGASGTWRERISWIYSHTGEFDAALSDINMI
jgi:hypothetical protein